MSRAMRALWALGVCLVVFLLSAGSAGATLTEVSQFGSYGSGDGQMISPAGVAANPVTGDVYVVDQGNQRVDEFDSQGTFLRTFGWGVTDGASQAETCTSNCQSGSSGSGAGQFAAPTGVAIDPSTGNVYVVDGNNIRVQEFDATGTFILTFGPGVDQTTGADICTAASGDTCGIGNGGNGTGAGFQTLSGGIAVNSTGDVYVDDWGPGYARVAVFTSGGAYEPGKDITSAPNGFNALALSFDTNGALYEADASGAVNQFDSAGTYLRTLPARGAASIAIDTSTNHALVGENNLYSQFDFLEYDSSGQKVSAFGAGSVSPFSTGAAWNPVPTTTAQNGFSFTQGVLLATDPGNGNVAVFARPIAQLPSVDDNWVTGVGSAAADVHAQINPNFGATNFYIQYGTSTAYGNTTPAPPGQFVSDQVGDQSVLAHLSGLTPATTYHYRVVATNSAGTTNGPDKTFTTYPPATAFTLPDGRAYEQVSPAAKDSSDISYNAATKAAADGNSVVFGSSGSFAGCAGGDLPCEYVGSRGSSNWSTVAVSPPTTPSAQLLPGDRVLGASSDFTKQLVTTGAVLAPGATSGGVNMYIHDSTTGSYSFVASGPWTHPATFLPSFLGASPNFDHVYFMVSDQFGAKPASMTPASVPATPAGLSGGGGTTKEIYDYTGGVIHLVGVLPDGSVDPHGASDSGGVIGYGRMDYRNVVSVDGSTVFWVDSVTNVLYATRNDTQTVAISTPQGGPNGTTPQPALPGWALPDGSKVYFLSSQLTANGSGTGSDLYQYDLGTGTLTDLTTDTADASGAGVSYVAGAQTSASGGTYVYFIAAGALASGASPNQNNLYVWHDSGTGQSIRFIAALSSADADIYNTLRPANDFRTSPDGRYLGFYSTASLTGYDNRDINTGTPDAEAYLYDANAGTLTCASCLPTGERPSGSVSLTPYESFGSLSQYVPRSVSDAGQFFFQSPDALVPADTNGMQDVYEYENGRISLLSTGRSTANSYFGDASVSGSDVFILTRERLVGQDQDNAFDLYDARVAGGFPGQTPTLAPPCDGDGCLNPYTSAPAFGTPGSGQYSGPGNVKASPGKAKPSVHVLRVRRRAGVLVVTVWTSGGGQVVISGRYLRTTQVRVRRAGSHVIVVRLSPPRRGARMTRVRVRYRAGSGQMASVSVAMRIAVRG